MIINPKIESYIEQHSTVEDELLQQLNRETHLKVINPRMLSGHPQGLFLEMISCLVQPKKILEIGTYTGYSGICLAKGLKKGGHLHTIERNEEIIRYPEKYFEKAGLASSTTIHIGNALEIIPTIEETFDLVFIDADKQQYIDYYNLCMDKLRPGGLILADNVLWAGKVVQDGDVGDPDTQAILDFNQYVQCDKRVEVVIIPLRDGISMVRKL